MNVELGAGADPAPDHLAVDLNPQHADLIGDAVHLPFADGTLDALRAVDVLEHISYRDTDAALKEWARALRPGGTLYVQVPCADTIMQWYVTGDARLTRADTGRCDGLYGTEWRLLGGHADGRYVNDGADWRFNAHYSLWSERKLRAALGRAGFEIIMLVTNGHPNLCVDARIPLHVRHPVASP